MRFGILQINPVVGDIPGNAARLAAGYARLAAAGADVVIAPELALTGYPPRDLVLKSRFVPATREALAGWRRRSGAVPLVGRLCGRQPGGDRQPVPEHGGGHAERAGHATRIRRPACRPTMSSTRTDISSPATEKRRWSIGGPACGMTICEDVWNDEDFWASGATGATRRTELREAGAKIHRQPAASPWHLGKPDCARDMLGATGPRRSACPIVYCNRWAATTSWFSTASLAVRRRMAACSRLAPESFDGGLRRRSTWTQRRAGHLEHAVTRRLVYRGAGAGLARLRCANAASDRWCSG